MKDVWSEWFTDELPLLGDYVHLQGWFLKAHKPMDHKGLVTFINPVFPNVEVKLSPSLDPTEITAVSRWRKRLEGSEVEKTFARKLPAEEPN